MYTPELFAISDSAALERLIDDNPFGMLVVPGSGPELEIAHLPMVLDRQRNRLQAHVARANPIWRSCLEPSRDVVAVFRGPDAYVSPAWYEDPRTAVPTWNYAVVHVSGRSAGPLDAGELAALLDRLVARFEDTGWSRERISPGLFEQLVQNIVGFDIAIERMEGKFKLSQNRPESDRRRVVAALEGDDGDEGGRGVAAWMRRLGVV